MNKRFDAMRRSGFSLLELLVVVAILAIVGGGLIVAYDGLESKAAKGQATNTIAAVDNAVRTFTAAQRTAPNHLDSLVAIDALDAAAHPAAETDAELLVTLPEKLAGKVQLRKLGDQQGKALAAAGITQLRYILKDRNVTTGDTLDNILNADIPNRVFDDNDPTKNRGRGGSVSVKLGTSHDAVVAEWKPGTDSVNNTKLGAGPTDVLVALGLGSSSDMIGSTSSVGLSTAPFYGDTAKHEYNRYILLYNLGPALAPFSKAKLQAVLDTRGDFLDEEQAEFTGQKL